MVTNGLYSALELNFSARITTIVLGGTMRRRSSSLVRSLNEDWLRRRHLDLGFLGERGVTTQDGLMESDLDEAQLKQYISSVFAQPDEIDWLITDARADGNGQ